jgi:hypothetical protein
MAHAGILAMENRRLVSYRSSNDSYQFIIYNKRMTIYIDALTWAWCRWDSIAIDMWTRCRNEIYGLWGAELAVIPPPLAFLLYVPSVCLHSFLTFYWRFVITFRPPLFSFPTFFLSVLYLPTFLPTRPLHQKAAHIYQNASAIEVKTVRKNVHRSKAGHVLTLITFCATFFDTEIDIVTV